MEGITLPSVNEIYKGQERIRILYVNQQNDIVAFIKMDKQLAYPEILSLKDFNEDVHYEHYTPEPLEAVTTPPMLSDKQINDMESRWAIISDFVKDEPYCYQKRYRTKFVTAASIKYSCTVYTINLLLFNYWRHGMTKYSLLPHYYERGGKGKSKTQNDKKLGRPAKYSYENEYMAASPEMLSHMRFIINNSYNNTRNMSLRKAYQEMIEKFYIDSESGKIADSYPTLAQFNYYAKKYIDPVKREGRRKFNKDLRGITGSSKGEAVGPGDKYQIDATIADIYLISARDHKSVIGRPTLYFVTDVFSRMITGFYVGLENPSWKGAIMALLYTFCDKQAVCNMYGVSISENDWPCNGLPKKILCDNGEMISNASNALVQSLGVDVENAAAWRPDLKGIVEQSFHQLNLATKSILPGAVQPDFNVRGSHDYRKDAVLTLKEYAKIVIYHILKYNSRQMKTNPVKDEDALRDHIPPIPIEIWNWGILNRSGQLRKVSEEQIKIALLPRETARVTEKGIKFKNIYYTCESAIKQDWFSKARINKSWKCNIAYDPRDLSRIYILEFGKPELAEKTSAFHNLFEDWTEEDFDLWIEQERNSYAKNERTQFEQQYKYDKEIQNIIKNAEERSKVTELPTSNSIKGSNIRAERAKDKEIIRREESFVRTEAEKNNLADNTNDNFHDDDNILSNLIEKLQGDTQNE
jgi:hypothetical protein